MTYKGFGLLLFALFCSGCAAMEEPRWVLLGDTTEKAFFLDRFQIERLPNGNYQYPVKASFYKAGEPHQEDDGRSTNRVTRVEMNCQKQQWTEAWNGFMSQNGKIVFRHINQSPIPNPVEPGTIHFSVYNYLCRNKDIVAQHNH